MNSFKENIGAMFEGINNFLDSKTVVGEPMRVGDTIIVPLVDVTCGMATGAFNGNSKENGGGGMSAKMTPSAILVIQNGATKLINVKNQDAISKILDMVPDVINKLTNKNDVSDDAVATAEEILDAKEAEYIK